MYSNYSGDKTTAPKIAKKPSSKDMPASELKVTDYKIAKKPSSKDMPASELKVTDYKTTARRPKK